MCNSCATEDHKMSALCVPFSDLGRILRLLLFRVDITTERNVGMVITELQCENLYAEQGHV